MSIVFLKKIYVFLKKLPSLSVKKYRNIYILFWNFEKIIAKGVLIHYNRNMQFFSIKVTAFYESGITVYFIFMRI